MKLLFEELKRRNVIKAAMAYLVVAWVLLQFFTLILDVFEAPKWIIKLLTTLLAIGFPLWVVFSWIFEITPDGLKRTKTVSKDQSITHITKRRLNYLILMALSIAIILGVFNTQPIFSKGDFSNLDKTSIAVLPLEDLSPQSDHQWFYDGITVDKIGRAS